MEHPTPALRYSETTSARLPSSSNQPRQDSAPLDNISISHLNHRSPGTAVNSTTAAQSHQDPKEGSISKSAPWTKEWIIDWWGIELACWVLAALSLAAIVIILESHKNQPMPEWSLGITLNSYISIFATMGQMAMMKPVVECISQLKWLWFARKKKLTSFEAFDDASRGPLGSLLLFWKVHGIHLVSLGAAITIISAAFGPFAQQVVTYPLRLHPVGTASTPQVFNFTVSPLEFGFTSPVVLDSIDEGLATGNFSLSTIAPICSTGNCTFNEYLSLGVCTSVSDLSSIIIHNACNLTAFEEIFEATGFENPGYPCFNYTLPRQSEQTYAQASGGGLSNATLTNAFTDLNLNQTLMEIMSVAPSIDDSSSGLVSTLYLMYQPGFSTSINSTLPSPIAFGLDVNLCIQRYNTTVSNGVTNTTLLSSQILETNIGETYSPSIGDFFFHSNDSYISIEGKTYGISNESLAALSDTLQYGPTMCYEVVHSNMPGISDRPVVCDFASSEPFLNVMENSTDPMSDITKKWNNMAISMTNAFRNGSGGDTQLGQFQGIAYAPIAFVETNYLWLILPIALVVLTLVFLLATISKSKHLGSRVWKSSNLATLQGLSRELHTELGGLSSISEMEEKAERVEVRFNLDLNKREAGHEGEYRLVESKQDAYWKG